MTDPQPTLPDPRTANDDEEAASRQNDGRSATAPAEGAEGADGAAPAGTGSPAG